MNLEDRYRFLMRQALISALFVVLSENKPDYVYFRKQVRGAARLNFEVAQVLFIQLIENEV